MGQDGDTRPRAPYWDPAHPNDRVYPQLTEDEAVCVLASRVHDFGDERSLEGLQLAARSNPTAAALLPRALLDIAPIRAMGAPVAR